eukprot:CAMPEP_0201665028 /NCGR_PEP_ID=MMETSP0494-20130426/6317_1 /ASSEMBLY_ACC=CAM_ASM_000839 /TAXON_ID=420259 /ORGANISM="Thalassiosira gravida, Strain GMp14c1" /LENGTH=39 /DNA_ID= /DNA_START= /DNA_END= /DNA_ORIENTATION=
MTAMVTNGIEVDGDAGVAGAMAIGAVTTGRSVNTSLVVT